MPEKIIIADTTCLISLSRIRRLNILKDLYSEIFITSIIKNEYAEQLPPWIKIMDPKNDESVKLIGINLDQGESTAIALAMENENSLLIIDERKGRRIAKSLNLKIIGLLGIIIKAKQLDYIDSVKDIIADLEAVEFRISESLKNTILKLANEE